MDDFGTRPGVQILVRRNTYPVFILGLPRDGIGAMNQSLNHFNLPNNELHLAPASRVNEDRDQLWIARAKDAMRPDGHCEKTLLFITSLEDQLKHKGSREDLERKDADAAKCLANSKK